MLSSLTNSYEKLSIVWVEIWQKLILASLLPGKNFNPSVGFIDGYPRYMNGRVMKDLELDDDGYPIELEGLAPPSLRDREFLQHSSLWGSQFIAGGSGEGSQHLKPDGSILSQPQMKTDPTLPAYCNPPNPCPVGYSGI